MGQLGANSEESGTGMQSRHALETDSAMSCRLRVHDVCGREVPCGLW